MTTDHIMWALQALAVAVSTLLWFYFRDLKSKVENVAKELADYKLTAVKDFAQKDDLHQQFDRIFQLLNRIEEKLDNKVDKP